MLRKILVGAAALLVLAGCSARDFGYAGTLPDDRKCADLFIKFYTTDGTTKGIWDCTGSDLQFKLKAAGQGGSDQALAAKAEVHNYRYVGKLRGPGYVYEVYDDTRIAIVTIALDKQGKVGAVDIHQI